MQQSDEEIVLAALDGTADEKLTGLALQIVLSDNIGITYEEEPDFLTEAEQVVKPNKWKAVMSKANPGKRPRYQWAYNTRKEAVSTKESRLAKCSTLTR